MSLRIGMALDRNDQASCGWWPVRGLGHAHDQAVGCRAGFEPSEVLVCRLCGWRSRPVPLVARYVEHKVRDDQH
jgi:hypothetical protein